MHIERFGTQEVEGIEDGLTYIFPKIDGTNGQVWIDDGVIKCGSRKRELFPNEKDNHGFREAMLGDEAIHKYLNEHPTHKLFGEWLVSHTIKHYKKDAWRKFYIFDVLEEINEDEYKYLPYEEYSAELKRYGFNVIEPLSIIENGSHEKYMELLDKNTYLIDEENKYGEGIVIKRYDFVNCYGRTTWAKIVRQEFKQEHKSKPLTTENKLVEEKIVNTFCTDALIEKTYAKIVNESGWSAKFIPRLIETVYHDLITEEMWNIIKKIKPKTINFQTLKSIMTSKIKEVKSEVFYG